jgi:hypothetical protein
MDPVTLHFNVFQAGTPVRHSLQVDDQRGTTILDLKQQLFSDELKASKSVRFIASGKVLADSSALEQHKLGKEAHIHVAITDASMSPVRGPAPVPGGENTSATATEEAKSSNVETSTNRGSGSMAGWAILLGVMLFAGTGAALYVALRKRYQYTMHTSQLLFICAAVWVYLLLFHGLPSLFQALNKLGNSTASKDLSPRNAASSSINPVSSNASDEASSATASSSPGLSVMPPTLASGNASAASVLTQRH